MSIRVMIADDHNLVREGLGALLGMYPEFEVVGQAADGVEAIKMSGEVHPDIILMDIAMPGLGGLEATVEILKANPRIKVLVLSQYDDREYLSRFFKAGASGYILKKAMGAELVNAIHVVMRGETYLYPSVASLVVDEFVRGSDLERELDPYDLLTDREKQVLRLIGEGYTQKEIAATLGISTKTAVTHQTHISDKLGIHTKVELIKFAIAKGIVRT